MVIIIQLILILYLLCTILSFPMTAGNIIPIFRKVQLKLSKLPNIHLGKTEAKSCLATHKVYTLHLNWVPQCNENEECHTMLQF